MTISIDQKGAALEFKLYGLDNNFKDLLLSGRVGYKSEQGQQVFQRRLLAPGDSWTYAPVLSALGHPSILLVRAEPKSPGGAVVLAAMDLPHLSADKTTYDSSAARAGLMTNYSSGDGVQTDSIAFEIDKLFVWSGIFSSLTLSNPQTSTSSVQVAIFEG